MKRLNMAMVVAVGVSLLSPTLSAASQCKRCATISNLSGTYFNCCNDTEWGDPSSCYVYGHFGWVVGDRYDSCSIDPGEGCWVGDSCMPVNTAPSPLLLSLNGIMPRFASPKDGVVTEMGLGRSIVRTAWPVGANAGWLVLDSNGNGEVDGLREMFTNGARLSSGGRAATGFAALADLDTDHDGVISPADAKWRQLAVWFDRNRDGKSNSSELVSLSALRVGAIAIVPEADSAADRFGTRSVLRAPVRISRAPRASVYAVRPATAQLAGVSPSSLGQPCSVQ